MQMLFNHSAPSITLKYIEITDDEIDKSLENFSLLKKAPCKTCSDNGLFNKNC